MNSVKSYLVVCLLVVDSDDIATTSIVNYLFFSIERNVWIGRKVKTNLAPGLAPE